MTDPTSSSSPDGRLERLRRDRPTVYAARHLIKPVAQMLLPILGIGVLLGAWIDAGSLREWVSAPFVRVRELVSWVPDPLGWAAVQVRGWVGEVTFAPWMSEVARVTRWWLPLLFAVAVAVREARRRRADDPQATATPNDLSARDSKDAEDDEEDASW